MTEVKTNAFYHGDCLFVMRHDIPPESIDPIYLDPPFFTGKVQKGEWKPGDMQISYDDSKAFWSNKEIQDNAPNWLKEFAIREPKSHWHPFARYLYYMMERLQECKNVLKSTGSIYLHCDWHANAHLRILMDEIFGENNFRNEIIWCYGGGGIPKKDFPRKHDTIFRYAKDVKKFEKNWVFNKEYRPYGEWTKEHEPRHSLTAGGGKLDMEKGTPINDWWSDLKSLTSYQKEWLGYPTQKPESLLERIIKVSSNPTDIVLDPMCGCGTTLVAAHKLGRQWIGIDVSPTACKLVRERF